MNRLVYVNGEYLSESDAQISAFDRGFLFADGVYEVVSVIDGHLIDNDAHLKRLSRSLGEIGLSLPLSDREITTIQDELLKRNTLNEGIVYMQISRGAADRDFAYPKDAEPSIVMFTQEKPIRHIPILEDGAKITLVPDIRWKRRDIKTVSLLAQSMAKQTALDNGTDDAWLVEDGFITEAASSNVFIIDSEGTLITRELSYSILPGITRQAILNIAKDEGMAIAERAISTEEVITATEAFSTSAATLVIPVVAVDGHSIGNGKPGATTQRLRDLYLQRYTVKNG